MAIGIEITAAHRERIADFSRSNQIGVLLARAVEAGVKIVRNERCTGYRNVHRKMGVDGERQTIHRNGMCAVKIGDIPPRVDTGIRAADTGHRHVLSQKGGERFGHGLLYGACVALGLPAVIGSAVIAENNRCIQRTDSFL